jgi:hypothetical protein
MRKMILSPSSWIAVVPRNLQEFVLRALLLMILSGCGGNSQPDTAPANSTPANSGGAAAGGNTASPGGSAPSSSTAAREAGSGEKAASVPTENAAEEKPAAPKVTPGISNPALFSADDVTLPEETLIVGIIVDGKARAYVCEAMMPVASCVVNDVIEKTPVTVTFHGPTKGVRVLAGESSGPALSVGVQSSTDEALTISIDGIAHAQSDEAIALKSVDHVQTEWIAWKTEHPETMVFLGTLAEKFGPAPSAQQ